MTGPIPTPEAAPDLVAGPPAKGRRPRPIFLLVGVAVAVALAIGLFTGVGTHGAKSRPASGSAVPAFSLPRLGGHGKVGVPSDGGGGGRAAILVFFASWCDPCQKEIPGLARTYERQQRDKSPLAKVQVVGIDSSDPTQAALSFVRKSGVTFPVGADRSSTVTEGVFQFTGLPESVFVEQAVGLTSRTWGHECDSTRPAGRSGELTGTGPWRATLCSAGAAAAATSYSEAP